MNGFWKELDPRTVRNPETSYFQWTRHNIVNTRSALHISTRNTESRTKQDSFQEFGDRPFPVQHALFGFYHSPDLVAAADIKFQDMVATRK